MTSSNDPNDRGTHRVNPDNAATDPRAAAQQDQVKADHDALEEQARRVEASIPSDVRDPNRAATDPRDAAQQAQIRADHDRLEESARRVEASVPAEVRDTPIQRADLGVEATEDTAQSNRNVDAARQNAEAARESARRVEQSTPDERDRDRR
jgi:hypothetical protein